MDYYKEIIREIAQGKIQHKNQLEQAKKELAVKLGLSKYPTNADILSHAGKHKKDVIAVLQKKPTRTKSGVAIVAVMTPPHECPHGKCVYCPGGTSVNTPQSYTGREPAAMRGQQYGFKGFSQTTARVKQLEMIGHNCDKVELIVMGGTFPSLPLKDQQSFVKSVYEGLNGETTTSLERAMKRNEDAKHRCVGLTVETRPDYCQTRHINNILTYGATRVELGVQHPDDEIYFHIGRGHSVEDVVSATQKIKDSGLKVCYHMMPNLPGSSFSKDLRMFKQMFSNQKYMPDMMKIYPTLLIDPKYGETELYEMFKDGDWKPYTEKKMVDLLAKAKSEFPKWTRIMRVQRDIPSTIVYKGIQHTNLRQIVQEHMKDKKMSCDCIRCREIGDKTPKNPKIKTEKYKASCGEDYFISLEDKNNLVGFVRLRNPSEPFREEITDASALIRELHVYGSVVPISKQSKKDSQHKGYGKQLLAEAEKIAQEEFDAKKLLVTSGIGVRDYYKKQGYELDGPYMSKVF